MDWCFKRTNYRILHKIFEKINRIYEEKITEEKNKINTLVKSINVWCEKMKNNGTELMTFLKEMFRYDDNFTIYLQDILSIDEIYFEAVKARENAYRKYIVNSLSKVNTDLIDS